MQRLRQASVLARLVLAWFVLAVGVAAASPLVQPTSMQLVCSGSGAAKLVPSGDGTEPVLVPTLDCPLCASLAPPPAAHVASDAHHRFADPVAPLAPVRVAERTAAPLPARGPPSTPIA